jgi:MazG family protein
LLAPVLGAVYAIVVDRVHRLHRVLGEAAVIDDVRLETPGRTVGMAILKTWLLVGGWVGGAVLLGAERSTLAGIGTIVTSASRLPLASVRRVTEPADALTRLDALTRRLRVECPWDREQDERSIVPHTVEEAYELAQAAHDGDDAKLLDELGDVLFQVHFLSLLLEERGAGSLAEVAEHCRQKLIRRHPHVFGDEQAGQRPAMSAGEVLRNWDTIKRDEPGREPGLFGEVPENLPGPLYARKVQRRAASSGFDFDHVPYDAVEGELEELRAAEGDREAAFHEAGDVLFAAVNVARKLRVDPELALRAAAARFRGRVEGAAALAARAGTDWHDLAPSAQLGYYAEARLAETEGDPE